MHCHALLQGIFLAQELNLVSYVSCIGRGSLPQVSPGKPFDYIYTYTYILNVYHIFICNQEKYIEINKFIFVHFLCIELNEITQEQIPRESGISLGQKCPLLCTWPYLQQSAEWSSKMSMPRSLESVNLLHYMVKAILQM